MKTLSLFFLFCLINTTLAQDFKYDLKSLSDLESSMLKYYSEKKLSNEELQEKYFLAANFLYEKKKYDLAEGILEKGLVLANPRLEFLQFLNSLYEEDGKLTKSQNLYNEYLFKKKYRDFEEYLYLDIIRTISLGSSVSPSSLIKVKMNDESSKLQITWLESLVFAKKREFAKAYDKISFIKPSSPDENIYISFLQKKIKKAPKYCLKLPSLSSYLSSYEEICSLIISENADNLESKIKEKKLLMKKTPLYEAIR